MTTIRNLLVVAVPILWLSTANGEEDTSDDGVTTLPTMEVKGEEIQPYQIESSTAGTRFEAEQIRIPQGIQVLPEAQLKDQGVIDMQDVLRSVPSANIGQPRIARFGSFSWTLRGFDAGVTRNGFRQLFFEDIDQSAFSNVERVEILKGPGAAGFGQEGLGGVINLVTKRPQKERRVEIQGTIGEFDLKVGTFDVTGPLSPNGALSARLTGEIERSGTFVDFQDIDRENFALALDWDDGGPLRGFVNAEFQERRTQANPGLPVVGTITSNGVGEVSEETFLGEPNFNFLESSGPLIQAWAEYDINENWTISPRFQFFQFQVKQDQFRLAAPEADNLTIARTGRHDFREDDETYTAQLDLTGNLLLGPTKHELLAGFEYVDYETTGNWFPYQDPPSINALNPTYLLLPPAISPDRLDFSVDLKMYSFYLQDLVSITPQLDLYGGFRYSGVDDTTSFTGVFTDHETDALTFNIGASYRPIESVSFFAGYATGFDIDGILGNLTAGGESFDPEESKQLEGGIKVNFPWGLTGTVSGFHIVHENVSTPDPVDPFANVQTGEETVNGAEIEFAYQILPNWFFQAGYAFLDTEITSSNAGDEGNNFRRAAEHQGNVWTRYTIDRGMFRNLSFGAGANYVTDAPGDNANTFDLPAYTTLDLSAAYQWNNFRAEIFAKNVLDEEYFFSNRDTSVFPGDPRTVYGRIVMEF